MKYNKESFKEIIKLARIFYGLFWILLAVIMMMIGYILYPYTENIFIGLISVTLIICSVLPMAWGIIMIGRLKEFIKDEGWNN